MKIIEKAFYHWRSILFVAFALAIAGSFVAFKMPVTLFPNVDFPRVEIYVDAGVRPANQMSVGITTPIEKAVRAVPGVININSTTSRGSAEIAAFFNWGTDMVSSLLLINSLISQISTSLPTDVKITTQRMAPTVYPIISYSMISDEVSLSDLYNLACYKIAPYLQKVDGVADIQIVGGDIEEYHINFDLYKLSSYNISVNEINKIVSDLNKLTIVGRLEDRYQLFLLISKNQLSKLQDIKNIIIKTGSDGIIKLGDIANIAKSTKPNWIKVTADGRDSVLFQVIQQPDGNSVKIASEIKDKLALLHHSIPNTVKIANWYDQSQLVTESAKSVRDDIVVGVIMAALILFLFLKNVKIMLISLVVVPLVLTSTIVLLYVCNMGFNTMTLGGMSAAIGLVIDDAVVVIEQIIKKIRTQHFKYTLSKQKTKFKFDRSSVLSAAMEIIKPLSGSSASTLIIFTPLAFLSGVTGAFFKALSITMASCLFFSYLIATFVIPILAKYLLTAKDAEQEDAGKITKLLYRLYIPTLSVMFRYKWLAMIIIIPLVTLGWVSYKHVGSGFLPPVDEGGFVLDYYTAPGTSLTETNRILENIEHIISNTADVDTYTRRTGTQLGGGVTEANEGDMFVRLKPYAQRRPIDEVMNEVRTKVNTTIPGIHIELKQLMEDVIGDLNGSSAPVEIKLFSDNFEQLILYSKLLANKVSKIQGVVDVSTTLHPAGDAIEFVIDQVKAISLGADISQVTDLINSSLQGNLASKILQGIKTIGIRTISEDHRLKSIKALEEMPIQLPSGEFIPLKTIAEFKLVSGQPQITTNNMRRTISVTGRMDNNNIGGTISKVKKILSEPGALPKNIYYELGGLYKQQQTAFYGLMIVFVSAVMLVFSLLLFLYEEFAIVFSIIITALIATSMVFFGLWITNSQLNISSIMGMTMIIGIVTEVAIFYFSEYEEVKDTQPTLKEALITAGVNRMRPILMTSITAIITLMPLALALGEGSSLHKPLAISIISGLIIQIPLVLIIMPIIYSYFVRKTLLSTNV